MRSLWYFWYSCVAAQAASVQQYIALETYVFHVIHVFTRNYPHNFIHKTSDRTNTPYPC